MPLLLHQASMGLAHPGIEIADPACVGKTWPGFWEALDRMTRPVATEVVAIDEAQFFDAALPGVCAHLAQLGKRVIVAGLDMDYRGVPFGPMPEQRNLRVLLVDDHPLARTQVFKPLARKASVIPETADVVIDIAVLGRVGVTLVHQGFDHSLVALSVGVQYMVRSDIGSSGVVFTLDTETGFRDAVFITAVEGMVPDREFQVIRENPLAGSEALKF